MKTVRRSALICFALMVWLAPWAHAEGQIIGVARLEMEDGSVAFADWVRVLLVRSAAEVPACPELEPLGKFARMETLRNLHMRFFVKVREKMASPDYVVRSTLTTPDGTFQFSALPAGGYFILVTFPAMIRDYKVAWQIPVTVQDHQTTQVELNHENLAIPTYSRE